MIKTLQNCTNPKKLQSGLIVACGQCYLCRARNQTEWNIRASHELLTSKGKAIFITMTYKTKFMAKNKSLEPKDLQKFWKRLRKKIKKPIKYLACGEYGDKNQRPHYHAIVFGLIAEDLPTKMLEKIWGMGRCEASEINASNHAIQYVTGYTRKKMKTRLSNANLYYKRGLKPPYVAVSKGLGKDWAIKNYDTWVKSLKVAWEGGEITVPRYYIKAIKAEEAFTVKYKKITKCEDMYITEWQYKKIENVLGPKTHQLNLKLLEERKKRLEEYRNSPKMLKRDDYFELIKAEEEEIEIQEKFLKMKAIEYVRYQKDPIHYMILLKNKRTVEERVKDGRYKTFSLKHKVDEKPDINCYGEMQEIAKNKELHLLRGLGGSRKL